MWFIKIDIYSTFSFSIDFSGFLLFYFEFMPFSPAVFFSSRLFFIHSLVASLWLIIYVFIHSFIHSSTLWLCLCVFFVCLSVSIHSLVASLWVLCSAFSPDYFSSTLLIVCLFVCCNCSAANLCFSLCVFCLFVCFELFFILTLLTYVFHFV